MSDANIGGVFHSEIKLQTTNENRRLRREEASSGQKGSEFRGHYVEIQMGVKSSANNSPPLTASISLVPSKSVLRSSMSLNIAAVCLRAIASSHMSAPVSHLDGRASASAGAPWIKARQ